MKKWILLTLALFLLMSQTLTCMAADAPLTVSNAQADKGEYVYLTVTLNKAVTADSIGLSYQYDPSHLKLDPTLCQWGKTGVLSDFDGENNGVWAGVSSENLQGKICVLAFKILDKASFARTEVSVTVILKNASENLGTYTATGAVTQPCSHSYGPWKSTGNMEHQQICEKCQDAKTESHTWNAGVKTEAEQGMSNITYTCTVCGQTKVVQVTSDSAQENKQPGSTEENKGGTILENYIPEETKDTLGQEHNGNQNGENPSDSHSGNSDSQEKHPDDPFAPYDPSEHDHDEIEHNHTGDQTTQSGEGTALKLALIIAVPAAAIVAAALYLKKKRRH